MDTDKLFDFIKVFFNEPKTYEDLTNHQKGRHQFMLNRFFSIQYPVQASNFNKLNTSSYGTAESWHLVALKFKRTPGFIFTKLNKNKKPDKKKYIPTDEALEFYLNRNEIGLREYKESLQYFPDKVEEDLKRIEKMYKDGNKNSN
mgnify:CR=1 FL=1